MGEVSSLTSQTQIPFKKEFPMVKGNGEDSYCKNSGVQAAVNRMPLLNLNNALERVTLPSNGDPVVVVDLGCSSGPNSIGNVALIVEKLRQRVPNGAEFQAYFNDLPSNDFNTLFQLLSNDHRTKNLYIAGVPGTYFGRLFAQSSVHVFYSSNCLHWLSELPPAILDKDSPAYNKGNPWIKHANSDVALAYQQQAKVDLENFLQARAAELVSGGLLFMNLSGKSHSTPNGDMDNILDILVEDIQEICSDLVAEGLLTEEQRDTINFPMFDRGIDDVKEAMACCESLFDVLTVTLHTLDISAIDLFGTSETAELSRKIMGMHKAVFDSVLVLSVGKEMSEIIWQRHERMVEKNLGTRPQDKRVTNAILILSLMRK